MLVVALLPMLTFFGHWPAIEAAIPGTSYVARVPLTGPTYGSGQASTHIHTGEESAPHDHSQHCHADVEGCSDTPVPGLSTVTMLQQELSYLGAATVACARCMAPASPLRPVTLVPLDPPPRVHSLHA